MGDLHQPLHTGYASDRGGNTDKYDFMGKERNLHHIWDMDIIEHEIITIADCIKIISKLSAVQIKEIEKMDVVKWMDQSRAFYLMYTIYKTALLPMLISQKMLSL